MKAYYTPLKKRSLRQLSIKNLNISASELDSMKNFNLVRKSTYKIKSVEQKLQDSVSSYSHSESEESSSSSDTLESVEEVEPAYS